MQNRRFCETEAIYVRAIAVKLPRDAPFPRGPVTAEVAYRRDHSVLPIVINCSKILLWSVNFDGELRALRQGTSLMILDRPVFGMF
jgi:hypothetical protein